MGFFSGLGKSISKVLSNPIVNPVGYAVNEIGKAVASGSGTVVDKAEDLFDWAKEAAESMSGVTANEIATQNLEYQKQYNEEIFNREDTSYQRLVEDLTAAGLNPAFGVENSSGAGAGGSTSAPKMTYRNEDITKPLQAIMAIRKLFGDLDEQEAKVNNLNAAAAATTAKTDSEIAVNEGLLKKMGFEIENLSSQTLLNETRADNEKRKTMAEITAAKAYEELHVSQKRQVDAETKILNDQADAKLKLITEQAEAAHTNNQFLADALRLANEISEKQRDKMDVDTNLAIQKFEHLDRMNQLEVAGYYYNLFYAAKNNVSIGTNPSVSGSAGLNIAGYGLDGKFSRTGGKSVSFEDFVKGLAPSVLY